MLLAASPAGADNCSDDPGPCSPRCVKLGNRYDRQYQAVERANRKLVRNGKQLESAQNQEPVNEARVRKLTRRDKYLRKLYTVRHSRLMRTYRRLIVSC